MKSVSRAVRRALHNSSSQSPSQRNETNVTVMLVVLVGCFLVGNSPAMACSVLNAADADIPLMTQVSKYVYVQNGFFYFVALSI